MAAKETVERTFDIQRNRISGLLGQLARRPVIAADLMQPIPTGSELLGRVSDDMSSWEKMLLDGLTK